MALILIPISLLDWRLTQWAPRNSGLEFDHKWSFFRNNLRITGVVVLWFQMAVVYFFAAIEKIPVEEWREGTAIYYWATDPSFGATGIRLSVLSFFTENLFFVVFITWGTIVLELLLAFGWMAQPRIKAILLILGIFFHLSIAFFMGLLSFSMIMSGALLMYLGSNSSIRLEKIVSNFVRINSTVKAQGASKGVI